MRHGGHPVLKWAGCGVLLLLAAAATVAWHWQVAAQTFRQQSAALALQASQLAGQHDAHLTALSAVALAPDDPDHRLFQEVAQSIRHYYPRIRAVELVPLAQGAPEVSVGPSSLCAPATLRGAAARSAGQLVLESCPGHPADYLLIKRSPNSSEARYALALVIDRAQLVQTADPYWEQPGASRRLELPRQPVPESSRGLLDLHFSTVLSSASQPLILSTGLRLGWRQLLDPTVLLMVLLLVSAAYAVVLALWSARARTRDALERARVSALDSRLAHASRVNTMGEMASGLAHELNQPLTSILALTQAGGRLLSQGDTAKAAQALQDAAAQAKRAAALLVRFRDWARPEGLQVVVLDAREVLDHVAALLPTTTALQRSTLHLEVPDEAVFIEADAVEMEQVVFNLLRNALEAVQPLGPDARIRVALLRAGDRVVLDVEDNGPGVPSALRERLFSPFVTGRPGGTGLGLALCQRLVERAQGEICLMDGVSALGGAHFRVSWPAHVQAGEREEGAA